MPSKGGSRSVQSRLCAAAALLESLPGIVSVHQVDGAILRRVAEEERRCESGGMLPVRNDGVRDALERQVVFALLKDRSFREPPAPTVYLVEQSDGAEVPREQLLEAGGKVYRILGEEVLPGRGSYREKIVSLAGSFVLFPERRAKPNRPSFFLVPALGFAELEAAQQRLGIRGVFSISPSATSDVLLRDSCGFAPDPKLATLLVGFDWD